MGDLIEVRLERSIGYLVFNRPQVHNAINHEMWEALPAVLQDLTGRGARCLILSGSGHSFASGADLDELRALGDSEQAERYWLCIWRAMNSLAQLDVPTIASVQGPCLGGGLLTAAACDLRFATVTATFALPVARLGILLDDDNLRRLVSLVGPSATKLLVFSGQAISATRALEIGLVDETAASPTDLEARVIDAAGAIAANSQLSIASAKAAIARCAGWRFGEQDQSQIISSYLSEEVKSRLSRA